MLETLQKVLYTVCEVIRVPEKQYSRAGYLHENYHYFHLRDSAGQERDFHFHEFDKLVMLLSGRVDYLVEDQRYTLRPGTVLLVRQHTIHKAVIDQREPYERIILYLDRQYFDRRLPEARLMDSFETAGRTGQWLLAPDEEQHAEIMAVLANYEKAEADKRPGAKTICETLIVQLLVLVGRLNVAQDAEERRFDPKIQATLTYINENLARELSVDTLAERVFLSRYHFMRLFKAQTGSTVHAYIRQKRLLTAARLIREGVPANKAALDAGFGDYSAFHRAFRQSFGVSPGALK